MNLRTTGWISPMQSFVKSFEEKTLIEERNMAASQFTISTIFFCCEKRLIGFVISASFRSAGAILLIYLWIQEDSKIENKISRVLNWWKILTRVQKILATVLLSWLTLGVIDWFRRLFLLFHTFLFIIFDCRKKAHENNFARRFTRRIFDSPPANISATLGRST